MKHTEAPVGGGGSVAGELGGRASEAPATWGTRGQSGQRHRRLGLLDGGAIKGVDNRGRSTEERSKASMAGGARRRSGRRRRWPGALGSGAVRGGAAGAGRG
jgi:hypothetical protein